MKNRSWEPQNIEHGMVNVEVGADGQGRRAACDTFESVKPPETGGFFCGGVYRAEVDGHLKGET